LLERWVGCEEHLRQCEAENLTPLVRLALRDHPFPRDIVGTFERRFYSLWLDRVLEHSPVLRQFRGDQHERRIKDFSERDSRHTRLGQRRLDERLALRQAQVVSLGGTEPTPETEKVAEAVMALIKEMTRKRHRSIRTIIQRTAPALLELKPCWMMSPLSVSQFFESAEPLFDVVIFDEASQVSAEDAICAILRGRQLVVVGDSKQLPPTRFFSTSLSDDDEDGGEDGEERDEEKRVESILDECVGALLPERSLRWHYRSRHESLIAFSNHHFYGNRLVTFPSPDAEHAAGVRFEYVADGVYDSGKSRTNRHEAERVADLVFEHGASHGTLKHLGVIALSQAQQKAVRDALNTRKRRSPVEDLWLQEIDEEDPVGFFVKNLETVQGDERDVILLSVGYGRDPSGRIHKRFGPVNLQGGERRLNVAVTRARSQLILVASMHADDLGSELANPGARALRNYLAYAEHGPSVLANQTLTDRGGDPESRLESPFEESVFQALTAKGLALEPQVGCSGYRIDLAVRDPERPGRYLLGIECDGATYHSSHTARDRDRLRQEHLERMGWAIHRIWSRDWAMDPVGQVLKIMQRLDTIRAGTPATPIAKPGEHMRARAGHREPLRPSRLPGLALLAPDTEAQSNRAPGTPHAALGVTSAPVPAPGPTRHVDGTEQTARAVPTVVGSPPEGSQQRQIAPSVPAATRHLCETCVFCTQQTSARFLCQLDRTVKVRSPSGKTQGCAAWVRRVT
jgi:very-short-patch-repair endonuclease